MVHPKNPRSPLNRPFRCFRGAAALKKHAVLRLGAPQQVTRGREWCAGSYAVNLSELERDESAVSAPSDVLERFGNLVVIVGDLQHDFPIVRAVARCVRTNLGGAAPVTLGVLGMIVSGFQCA